MSDNWIVRYRNRGIFDEMPKFRAFGVDEAKAREWAKFIGTTQNSRWEVMVVLQGANGKSVLPAFKADF